MDIFVKKIRNFVEISPAMTMSNELGVRVMSQNMILPGPSLR